MTGVTLYDLQPSGPTMLQEIVVGLSATYKQIHPKYLYDKNGSRLFDAITEQPEYYLTKTEQGILKDYHQEISATIGKNSFLMELGSGSSMKIRILLENIKPRAYMPIDISKQHLKQSANILANDYPWLDIRATCADYAKNLKLPWCPEGSKRVVFFSGSSLGNFSPDEAQACLSRIYELAGKNGGLLIGIDKQKSEQKLHAAYNDAGGVTAAFSLNVLQHINRSLGADFANDGFAHEAFYNNEEGRVEIYLRSLREQSVQVDEYQFQFGTDERILIEYSYKYTTDSFLAMAERAGFKSNQHWMDKDEYFSVFYLTA